MDVTKLEFTIFLKTDFALDDSCVFIIRYDEDAPFVSAPGLIIDLLQLILCFLVLLAKLW